MQKCIVKKAKIWLYSYVELSALNSAVVSEWAQNLRVLDTAMLHAYFA